MQINKVWIIHGRRRIKKYVRSTRDWKFPNSFTNCNNRDLTNLNTPRNLIKMFYYFKNFLFKFSKRSRFEKYFKDVFANYIRSVDNIDAKLNTKNAFEKRLYLALIPNNIVSMVFIFLQKTWTFCFEVRRIAILYVCKKKNIYARLMANKIRGTMWCSEFYYLRI